MHTTARITDNTITLFEGAGFFSSDARSLPSGVITFSVVSSFFCFLFEDSLHGILFLPGQLPSALFTFQVRHLT